MPVNMSYCMFENTLKALRECYNSEGMDDLGELSKYEIEARSKLISLCVKITSNYGDEDETT